MRDDLSGLRALFRVAQKRSFRAAAAEMRVTPSAVSQTIRALEERLGVRLLQRTTRSVGLTEAGAQYVARLKDRKSTRLNSSHSQISYAVFCLKKKKSA